MFTPPTPVLSLRSTEARASAPSPCPPRRVSRQASRAGECWSAPLLCVGISPLCPPQPCCCAVLRDSEASPTDHPPSLPVNELCSVWKPFLLHSSLPLVQVPSLFFCLCFFFYLLPYPGTWGVSCLLGGLTSSASVQWVFYRSSSTCRCMWGVSVGRKVISVSYSSAILKLSPILLLDSKPYNGFIILFRVKPKFLRMNSEATHHCPSPLHSTYLTLSPIIFPLAMLSLLQPH